jgi:hypothetical protein
VNALSFICFVLGLWLILAGFALATAARPVKAEEVVLGIITACLAAIAATRPSSIGSWRVGLAGLWTPIAPAAISYVGLTVSRANDIVVGVVVFAPGATNALYTQPAGTNA